MGLFSRADRCPKCGGSMDLDTNTAFNNMRRAANANDFSALGAAMMIGGPTYHKCKKCGYIEKRTPTSYGVSKQPYNG